MKSIYAALVIVLIIFGSNRVAVAQSTTFTYTASVIQTYTVPAGVTTLNIIANGAQGGDYLAPLYVGGLGAVMNAAIAVTPGHVLSILVGQQGGISPYCAGGGGGAFVWDATTPASPVILIAAGGGGGASSSENGNDASMTTNGSSGGGTAYEDGGTGGIGGTIPSGVGLSYGAGGCGWLTNGANGSTGPVIVVGVTIAGGGDSPNPTLTPGMGAGGASGGTSAGNGGFGGGGGGQVAGTTTTPSGGGAGGGGGYSGGGGGVGTPVAGGGSYCSGSISSITAANTGNGLVIIAIPCTVGPITGNAPLCVGSVEGLSDAPSGGTWMSTNTAVATIGSAGSVRGVAAGTDTILYILPTSCSTIDTALAILTVNPTPSAGTITGTDSVCTGHTVTLADATTGGTWSSISNTIATVAAGVVTGVTVGIDTIIYTVTNSCGSDSATLPIKVKSCPSEVNTISATDDLAIYPNPANEELTIKMSEESYNSFTITNYIGQVLMEQQLNAPQTTVNIKTLTSSALYYITFRGQNGISVQRFIKL